MKSEEDFRELLDKSGYWLKLKIKRAEKDSQRPSLAAKRKGYNINRLIRH